MKAKYLFNPCIYIISFIIFIAYFYLKMNSIFFMSVDTEIIIPDKIKHRKEKKKKN